MAQDGVAKGLLECDVSRRLFDALKEIWLTRVDGLACEDWLAKRRKRATVTHKSTSAAPTLLAFVRKSARSHRSQNYSETLLYHLFLLAVRAAKRQPRKTDRALMSSLSPRRYG